MEIKEYFRRRLEYENRARNRDSERMSLGSGMDDTPWSMKVIEEMLIDFTERLERIEALYTAPDDTSEEKNKSLRFY